MAISGIVTRGTFVPALRDGLTGNAALAGFNAQSLTGQAALLQGSNAAIAYDLFATANTTDATANEILISLTANGMTLPVSGNARTLIADLYMRGTANPLTDMGWLRVSALVFFNGTNPILVASSQIIDNQAVITAAAAAFFINTTPNPDEVTLALTGVAATSINWEARIYIGPLVQMP